MWIFSGLLAKQSGVVLGCGSVARCEPTECEALILIPSIEDNQKQNPVSTACCQTPDVPQSPLPFLRAMEPTSFLEARDFLLPPHPQKDVFLCLIDVSLCLIDFCDITIEVFFFSF